MPIQLRPITPRTVGFAALEAESLRCGFNMLARLRHNWGSDANYSFARTGEMLAGAFRDEQLVGIGGRSVDAYANDPRIGRVRHIYVAPNFRGSGIGRQLVENILRDAGNHFTRVTLRAPPAAFGFYEHLGFHRVEGAETMTHHLFFK